MPHTKTLVILAGGLGTRLQKLVNDVPKPMAPIKGIPFLEILINYWKKQGIEKIILSVGYLKTKIIDYFGSNYQNIEIEYSIENSPLGTGGGLIKALDKINDNEPFLIANGDTFFKIKLNEIESFHLNKTSDWTVALFESNDNKRYMSISMESNQKITNLKSNSDNLKKNYSNGGLYLVSNKLLLKKIMLNKSHQKNISLEDDIIPLLLRNNNFYGFVSKNIFIDIGIPEDYKLSANILKEEICLIQTK